MKVNFPIGAGAYTHPSLPTNNQRCQNLFITDSGPMGWGNTATAKNGTLLPTMGCVRLTDLAVGLDDVVRAVKYINGSWYCVVGTTVHKLEINEFDLTITHTVLGTLTFDTSKPISITWNPTQIIFTDKSSKGYIYTFSTGVFEEIADSDFLGSSHVVYIDGYFIYNKTTDNKVYFSSLNDGTAWNSLDVASIQGVPGYVVGLGTTKGELWAFKEHSVEVWWNEGNASPGSPFSKRIGSDIGQGCLAPYSIQNVNDKLIWLDDRGYVVQSDVSNLFRDQSTGYTLTKLSTTALDAEISSYPVIQDAIASTYVYRGHVMYEITFPFANKTHVFDTNTEQWHSRTYLNTSTGEELSSIAQFYDQNNDFIVGGGNKSGKIYLFSKNYYTDDSIPIKRLKTTPYLHENFNEIDITELELKCKTGQYVSSGASVTTTTSSSTLTTILDTTVTSFNTNSTINNTINTITNYNGEHSFTVASYVVESSINTALVYINGDHRSSLAVNDSVAVLKNNGTWAFGYITSFGYLSGNGKTYFWFTTTDPLSPPGVFPADPNWVGNGNQIYTKITHVTLKLTSPLTADYQIGASIDVFFVSGVSNPLFITAVNTTNNTITVIVNSSYSILTGLYTVAGLNTSLPVVIVSYVSEITLTAPPVGVLVFDTVDITLNDTTIYPTIITSIAGNVITFSGSIISTNLSNGNRILITRIINSTTSTTVSTSGAPLDVDPYIQMRCSHDGGATWEDPQIRSMGKLGEFNKRIMWNSLGSNREWLFEFLITSPIDFSIIDGTINLMVETN